MGLQDWYSENELSQFVPIKLKIGLIKKGGLSTMRGKILVSLLCILMLMVVAGCGPGAAPSTAGQSSGAAQEGSTAQESSDSTSAETSSAAEVEITGATSSERAIQGLKALNLPAGTKFTVFSEDLTIKMAEVNAEEFNKQTGLELETQTAPNRT
jgi:hypothetical protein